MGWLLPLLALVLAVAEPAFATPFGTISTAAIDLPGDALDGEQSETTVDQPVSTSSAWLTDGTTTAGALTPFGANLAQVASAQGTFAFASSMWADTLVLSGSTGTASLAFHVRLAGSADAGALPGGYAQAALRIFLGFPGDALAPAIVLAAQSHVLDDACEIDGCDGAPVTADTTVVLHADVAYGTAFRFGVLLEALAWGGGGATVDPGGWLERIEMPAGSTIAAASGRDYAPASVPEPATITLLASALAALARSGGRLRRRHAARSPSARYGGSAAVSFRTAS